VSWSTPEPPGLVLLQINLRDIMEGKLSFFLQSSVCTFGFAISTTVVTTSSTKEKLDWLASIPLGPTHTVNYKTQNFAEEIKAITGGKGIDTIVDFVGKSHWAKNIESLSLDGRMCLLAFLSGKINANDSIL